MVNGFNIIKRCNNETYITYETKPSILDFSREQSDINYQCGYETTMRVFDKKL
jgi:hypothetical protein